MGMKGLSKRALKVLERNTSGGSKGPSLSSKRLIPPTRPGMSMRMGGDGENQTNEAMTSDKTMTSAGDSAFHSTYDDHLLRSPCGDAASGGPPVSTAVGSAGRIVVPSEAERDQNRVEGGGNYVVGKEEEQVSRARPRKISRSSSVPGRARPRKSSLSTIGSEGSRHLKQFFHRRSSGDSRNRKSREGSVGSNGHGTEGINGEISLSSKERHFERRRQRERKVASVWESLYNTLSHSDHLALDTICDRDRSKHVISGLGRRTVSSSTFGSLSEMVTGPGVLNLSPSSSPVPGSGPRDSSHLGQIRWDEFRDKFSAALEDEEEDDPDRLARDILERCGGPANGTLLHHAYRLGTPPPDILELFANNSAAVWRMEDDNGDTPLRFIFDYLMGFLGDKYSTESHSHLKQQSALLPSNSFGSSPPHGLRLGLGQNAKSLDTSFSSAMTVADRMALDSFVRSGVAWDAFLDTFSSIVVSCGDVQDDKDYRVHTHLHYIDELSVDGGRNAFDGGIATRDGRADVDTYTSVTTAQALLEMRGGSWDDTLLHLVCWHDPPLEVVTAMMAASGDGGAEMVATENRHGCTPLHHALTWGASTEVVSALIEADTSGSGGKTLSSRGALHGYTPLHLAVRDNSPPEVVKMILDAASAAASNALLSSSLEEHAPKKNIVNIRDNHGETPLHHAIQMGASTEVCLMLIAAAAEDHTARKEDDLQHHDDEENTLTAMDSYGKLPLMHAIENGLPVEVVSELVNNSPDEIIFELLRLIVVGLEEDEENDVDGNEDESASAVGSMHIAHNLGAEEHEFQRVHRHQQRRRPRQQALSVDVATRYYPCLAAAVTKSREMQNMLNERSSERIFSALMMADLYVRFFLIVGYSIASDVAVRALSSDDDEYTSWYLIIYVLGSYLVTREVFQIGTQGMNWFFDESNWLDVLNISLLFVSTALMEKSSGDGIGLFIARVTGFDFGFVDFDVSENDKIIRGIIMATGAILWMEMLSFLSSTFLPFSVFVSGVTNILWKIIPFLISSFCVLGAFVHMYYVDSVGTSRCDREALTGEEDSKFCTFESSLVKVYSMFVGGTDEYLFMNGAVEEKNPHIQEHDFTYSTLWLSVLFGLLVQILLLNVLIVIVNESWDDVSRNGAEVFWENRLHFLSEVKSIRIGRAMSRNGDWVRRVEDFTSRSARVLFLKSWNDDINLFDYMTSLKHGGFFMDFCKNWVALGRGNISWVKSIWGRVVLLLKDLYQCLLFVAFSFLCVIGGFLSLGIFWPQSFRKFLFGSNAIDEHSNEMSKEVKRIHERCDVLEKKIDGMVKENLALLNKKTNVEAMLCRINEYSTKKDEMRAKADMSALVDEIEKRNGNMHRIQMEKNEQLHAKMDSLLQMLDADTSSKASKASKIFF